MSQRRAPARGLSLAVPHREPFVASPAAAGLLAVAGAGRLPRAVVVGGPGGTGKTWLLDRLADTLRARGQAVVGLGEAAAVPGPRVAVLVDDAHLLGARDAARVVDLLQGSRGTTLLAHRPGAAGPGWAAVAAALPADRSTVRLGHLDTSAVERWSVHAGPGRGGVADLLRATGGLPALVAAALDPSTGTPTHRVLDALTGLPAPATQLLVLVAAGAPWEADLLAEVLAVDLPTVALAVDAVWASGLVPPDGVVPPVVVAALADTHPAARTAGWYRRLLTALHGRGRAPRALAQLLARSGPDAGVAAVLVDLARVADRPTDALRLLQDAVHAGAAPTAVAGTRAVAAAATGEEDLALGWARTALAVDPHDAAVDVAVAVLAGRGLADQAADVAHRAAAGRGGVVALALLGRGDRAGAERSLATDPAPVDRPDLLAQELAARAVLRSLDPGGVDAALGELVRAQCLVGSSGPLLDGPAAIGVPLALHTGSPAIARTSAEDAVRAGTGGPLLADRHRLLAGWAALADADPATAAAHLGSTAGGPRRPRDELLAVALELALARRRDDVPALAAAWPRVVPALLAHPVDLACLTWVAEVRVVAARLGTTDQLRPAVTAGEELLARLDHPPAWTTPWHWAALQAAVLAGDPAGTGPAAAGLHRAGRDAPAARLLLAAGRTWLDVLHGQVDPGAVLQVADDLLAAGHPWEAARIAADAAARTRGKAARAGLLARARLVAERPVAGGRAASRLTPREAEVAGWLVAGCTHAEIGARLYLSPRTVEHHVARLRQRLGTTGRVELLDRLRAELGAVAP